MLDNLQDRIRLRQARVGVVGLGYVGLPLACVLADVGFDVVGVDLKEQRVETINSGVSPIAGREDDLTELVPQIVGAGMLVATTQYSQLSDRDIILVCVETPVGDDHIARYEALRHVCKSLGPIVKVGALVIVESTVAPGTVDGMVRPLIETATGRREHGSVHLGHCPERVMPGKLLENMRSMSRVIGAESPVVGEVIRELYATFVRGELDITDCVSAELVKTAENAYRDVNIAFANELALICDRVGTDVWAIRDLINKSPGRRVLLPGPGVGGHCIPKDSWLLASALDDRRRRSLIAASRRVNELMPQHMAELVLRMLDSCNVNPGRARVVVLGYAYLEGSDDTRHSPSRTLVRLLSERGISTVVHDPYVSDFHIPLMECFRDADCAAVMVGHDAYREMNLGLAASLMRNATLVDGRNVLHRERLQAAGFRYTVLGVGGLAQARFE
jgi:UDP-N-acetyl-D-mannosaminuronic acid dehydrogenase